MFLSIIGFLIAICFIPLLEYDFDLLSALFLIVGLAIMNYSHRKKDKLHSID